jgi:hypothetical protein
MARTSAIFRRGLTKGGCVGNVSVESRYASLMPGANDTIHRITIDARFGSDIQRDVSLKVLKEFLGAWKANVESAHKKNNITITAS